MPLDFVRYTPEIETITARELDVPRLIRDGHRYKQIAKKLGIAETTVSFHIQNLVQKLGANDKTHAVGHGADRDPQEGVRLCRELVAGPFLQAAQDFTVDEPWHQYPIVGHLLSISVPGGSGLRERRLK